MKYFKWKGIILLIGIFVLVFSFTMGDVLSINNSLSAESDSENIENEFIIDIEATTTYNGTGIVMALTSNGEVYTSIQYGVTPSGVEYKSKDAYKKIKLQDGSPLKNVKKIYLSSSLLTTSGNYAAVFALNDGTMYRWGNNQDKKFGESDAGTTCAIPFHPAYNGSEITDIKSVKITSGSVFILTNTGDVYACGRNAYGSLGIGGGGNTEVFVKLPISDVKQIQAHGFAGVALKNDGNVYAWGDWGVPIITPRPLEPTQIPSVEHIERLSEENGSVSENYFYVSGIDTNNIVHNNFNVKAGGTGVGRPNNKDVGTLIGNQTIAYMSNGYAWETQESSFILTTEGNLYALASNTQEYEEFTVPGIQGKIIKVIASQASIGTGYFILTDLGEFKVHDGIDIVKMYARMTGVKTVTGNVYENEMKYNGDISLNVSIIDNSSADIKLKEKNLLTSETSEGVSVKDGDVINVVAENDKRVYKEYCLYYDTKPNTVTFIVDLYKHAINANDVSVTEGGTYPVNKKLTWDQYNGLTAGENSVKAILTKDGVDEEITYDHAVSDAGSYTLKLTDDYGNTASYNFTVSLKPTPTGVTFTPSGTLKYKNEYTSSGKTLGELSLKYNAGDETSTIASAQITDGNADGYFSVVTDASTHKTALKAEKNVPAGTHTLKLKGTDANGMEFKDLTVELVIAKAENPITWHEDSAALKDDGIAFGNSVTLKTKGTPTGETIKVEYTLKSPSEYVSVNKETGAVTISGMPESGSLSVIFVATPSNNTNYDLKPIELPVTIKKQSIKLKTVIEDQGTSKDAFTINVGDPLPVFKVVAKETLPDGITMDDLGNPANYVYENDSSILVEHPNAKAGTYKIKADYGTGLDRYAITWEYASLTVKEIEISDNNASDYYSLTTTDDEGNEISYTPDTWTNHDVKVKAVHTDFDQVSIGQGTSAQTAVYSTEGETTLSLTFHHNSIQGAKAEVSIPNIKIDKTNPILDEITYTEKAESALMSLLSRISFDLITSKAQTATFRGSDAGSGIKEYAYTLSEIDEDGNVQGTAAEKTGNSVDLAKNTMYQLEVQAVDNAGNRSAKKTEYIKIDDQAGTLTVKALINGEAGNVYQGGAWTDQPIQITLSSDKPVTKYQVQIGNGAKTEMRGNTITIPNTAAINHVPYKFIAISDTGVETSSTLNVGIDPEQPDFAIDAQTADGDYTPGSESEKDITLTPRENKNNISGVTYYYTTDASASTTDPAKGGWTRYDAPIEVSTNGVKTYYFKSVSGAGKASELKHIETKLAKKEYTAIDVEVTSEGSAYQSGTWAKHDVSFTLSGGLSDESQITSYEYAETEGARPDANTPWKTVANKQLKLTGNTKNKSYWFRVSPADPEGRISTGTKVNLDVDDPSIPDLKIEVTNDC